MIPSPHGQTVGLLPGAGGGEGVAGCLGSIVPPAATRGQPCLGVVMSSVGKVGEGAEPGPVGVEKLHRGEGEGILITTTRYQDH